MSQTSLFSRPMLGIAEGARRPRMLCKAFPSTSNPSTRIGPIARAVATLSPPSPRTLTTVEHVEAQHPEFMHVDDLDAEMAAKFAQYQKATSAITTAAERSSQLEALLGVMERFEAQLDEQLLEVPSPVDDKVKRAAKRAAKRAERKAAVQPSSASTSASSPVAKPSSQYQDTVQDSRQALEELFQVSMPEASTSASLIAPKASVLKPKLAPKLRVTPKLKSSLQLSAISPAVSAPALEVLTPPASVEPTAVSSPTPAQGGLLTLAPAQEIPSTQPAQVPNPFLEDFDDDINGPSHADLAELEALEVVQQDGSEAVLASSSSLHATSTSSSSLLDAHSSSGPSLLGLAASAVASSSNVLEASALAVRGREQISIMPTGPSLLGLASEQSELSARSRHSRRTAVYGHGASAAAAKSTAAAVAAKVARGADGTTNLMKASGLLGDNELEITRIAQDFLFLEKVRRQCTRTMGREPTRGELAAAVNMDAKSFMTRYTVGQRAQSAVLRGNYRLVLSICKKYLSRGAALQDLVSEGIKGLMRGVEKYDPSRGFKFSTYAHWWIRQAITRSLAETGRAVRLPVHMVEQLSKVNTTRDELTEELQREPSLEEVAARCGFSVKRIQALLKAARSASSLDMTVGSEEGGNTLKDMVEDERSGADEELVRTQLESDINDVLAELKEREALVVRLRFGLHDGVEWTLEQIGQHMRVTRERVRQIETKALRKLKARQQLLAGKLHEYGSGLDLLEEHSYAARTSSGTKKT